MRGGYPGIMFLLASALAPSPPARAAPAEGEPSSGGGAYSLAADGVFEAVLVGQASETTVCETRNLTGSADPVLHILRMPAGNGRVSEIARNDNSPGTLNARVRFVLLAGARVLLVMRAARAGASGTADVICNDRPLGLGVGVGGAFKRLENLHERERLRTVMLPGGPRAHRLYLLNDWGTMLTRHVTGAGGTAFIGGGLQGMRNLMVGAAGADPAGDIRLIRNDAQIGGHDPDGDGLGSQLEANIGTCSSRSGMAAGFDCSRAFDARDTDGDGLQDGLELMGRLQLPFQHLPRWGADPRHKDVFVEVDFGMADPVGPGQRMSREQALALAALYADPETDRDLRLAHAQSLINPDRQPGISVHLDIGVAPPAGASPLEQVTYGDWGGFSVVPPVCDGAACRRADPGAVWARMMDPARHGIFHYALGDPTSGGQAHPHAIALNLPLRSARSAAHEFGHTLGLDHMGRPPGLNCMPNYPSLMNYGYIHDSAFTGSFSDGLGRAALNDAALHEQGAVSNPASLQGRRYLDQLRLIYAFNVDLIGGSVDWNRDGVLSGQPVRGYATFQPTAAGCEATRDSQIRASGLSDRAPALVRLGGRTMLFYIDERDGRIRLEIASGDLNCPKFGADCGTLVPRDIPFAWNRDIRAVDAHPMVSGDGRRLLAVVFRTGGKLFEAFFDGSGWLPPQPIATSSVPVGELSLAGTGGRMWLAFRNAAGAAFLKSRTLAGGWGPDEAIVDPAGDAIGPIAAGASPGILLVNHAGGHEVLLGAFPVGPEGMLQIYQRELAPILAPPDVDLHRRDGAWIRAPWPLVTNPFSGNPAPAPVIGKPALAFEPTAPGSPLPGRVHLLYTHRGAEGLTVVMQGSLIARWQGLGLRTWLLISAHDNIWLYGKGVDLLFERDVDTNLKAAVVSALLGNPGDPPSPHNIWLRPKADGIIDFPQRNFNDWQILGRGLCITLDRNGADVACPPAS